MFVTDETLVLDRKSLKIEKMINKAHNIPRFTLMKTKLTRRRRNSSGADVTATSGSKEARAAQRCPLLAGNDFTVTDAS